MSIWTELKRRSVVKVSIAYLVLAWFSIQLTDLAVPALNLPESLNSIVFFICMLGFPFALFFSWVFEITPEGLKRSEDVEHYDSTSSTKGQKTERAIMAVLALSVIFLVSQNYLNSTGAGSVSIETATTDDELADESQAPTGSSIAVLPFVDMSPEKDQEYFSDGISEEILNVLAKIPSLQVTSRSSAFSFKGQQLDLRAIAEQLSVAHILEGSVRKQGNQIRITAQLIETESDTHLWSETYDRELEDIFQIQDEISAAIGSALSLRLVGESEDSSALSENDSVSELENESVNPEAYNLYLQAVYGASNRLSIEETSEYRELFLQSIALDDSFAPAHSALAYLTMEMSGQGLIPLDEGDALVMESIGRALALDLYDQGAHRAIANYRLTFQLDLEGAISQFEYLLNLNPNNVDAHDELSDVYSAIGIFDLARKHNETAERLDPLQEQWVIRGADIEERSGNYGRALELYENYLAIHPGSVRSTYSAAIVMMVQGRAEEAIERLLPYDGSFFVRYTLAMAYFIAGDIPKADSYLDRIETENPDDAAFQIAEIYCVRNELQNCADWLERAWVQKDPGLITLLASDFLVPLYDDPVYLSLVEKLGFQEAYQRRLQHLAAIAE